MNRLKAIVDRFKGTRVAVIGDLIADVFVYGEIARVSREAPVLVLNHRETQIVPGGGANAIHNLWSLGARPIPVGLVGNDEEGRRLLHFFSGLRIDTKGITVSRSYRTPSKMRILAGAVHSQRQQIVRLDTGSPLNEDKLRRTLQQKLKVASKQAQALLISDYGYGLIKPQIT
jgi:rfaE bifunctional protein kinase chain/domain